MKEATLAQLQRWAETEMRRLGIERSVEVRWGGDAGSDGHGRQVPRRCISDRWLAHAHVDEGTGPAVICIRRGLRDPRETIKHEVAHFAPGGTRHGTRHVKAMAKLGVAHARAALVRQGKARCPKHEWERVGTVSQKVTARGLLVTYSARCWHCGKKIGGTGA